MITRYFLATMQKVTAVTVLSSRFRTACGQTAFFQSASRIRTIAQPSGHLSFLDILDMEDSADGCSAAVAPPPGLDVRGTGREKGWRRRSGDAWVTMLHPSGGASVLSHAPRRSAVPGGGESVEGRRRVGGG